MTKIQGELLARCLSNVRRTAASIARRVPSFITLDDLIGAGNLGLAEAIRKFESGNRSCEKFEAYASFRIRGEMISLLRKLDYMSRDQRRKQRKAVLPAPTAIPSPEPSREEAALETSEDLLGHAEELAVLRTAVAKLPSRLRFIMERSCSGEPLHLIGKSLGITESRTGQLRTTAHALIQESIAEACRK